MSIKRITPATHEEWLQLRTNGIGSSEIGTIMGVNKWQTPLDLFHRKQDERKGIYNETESEAALRGHIMEDAVAMYWQNKNQKYNRTVIKASAEEYIVVNDAAPFLQASPDRTFWLDEIRTPDNKGILECKTTLMQVDPNDPPLQWVYQVMWLMGATGMKTSSLAWIGYNFEFGFVNIDFDQQLFNVMLEMASDFWCKLERGIEPAPINANDIVKLYPKEIEGNSVEASAELCEAVERIKQLKVQLKDIDTEISELEDSVKVGMEGAEKLVSTGLTLATWKAAKDSTKFDSKRYQSDHPDECKDYIVTVPGSRRFLIK